MLSDEPWDVRFAAKFYPPEPSELRDDHSRYQLGLAIRRDLMEGLCSVLIAFSNFVENFLLLEEIEPDLLSVPWIV